MKERLACWARRARRSLLPEKRWHPVDVRSALACLRFACTFDVAVAKQFLGTRRNLWLSTPLSGKLWCLRGQREPYADNNRLLIKFLGYVCLRGQQDRPFCFPCQVEGSAPPCDGYLPSGERRAHAAATDA